MKVVLQDGIKDCGVCCLLSIIRFYKGDASKEYLRDLTCTNKSGVSAYNLVKAAETLGFNATGQTGKMENITINNLPCIAHVIINKSYQHFIVIYDIIKESKKIIIMDPAKGKKIISFAEFNLMTSNNYIFLNPNKPLPILKKRKVMLKTFINQIKLSKKVIIVIIILTISYFILNLLLAFHFKYFIENVINYSTTNNLLIISYIIITMYFFKEINSILRNILLSEYSTGFDEKITTKTFEQIISLPYLYYSNRTTGEIISRLKDLSNAKTFILKLIISLSTDIICFIIFQILLFKIQKNLALITSIMLVLIFIINLLFRKTIKIRTNNYYKSEAKFNSFLIESLSSNDVIKNIHIEKKILAKFINKYEKVLNTYKKLYNKTQILSFFKNTIYNISIVVILSYGTYLVVNNKMSLSELIIYQSVLNYHVTSFLNIMSLLEDYPSFSLSIERIEDLFNIKKEQFIGNDYYKDINLIGDIKYNNLTFSYNSKKLLDKVNLVIKPKEKVFFYGPSGSGKSTLIKILLRYIEVEYGKVSINKIDINHYHLDTIRKNITYVSQQDFLYSDTLLNNIKLSRNINEENIKKVCKNLYVDDIITDKEVGYNMLVEENGFNFSTGEKQRIILARSILKESDVYIFDEALSAIDIKRERTILEFLFKYLKNKTIIVISHRFDNKDIFDRNIEMKNGQIYENT